MTGVARAAFGDVDDRGGRGAIPRGGGSPPSRFGVLALERSALGCLQLAAGVGELGDLLG
jgi:hypothetical protein